MILLGRLHALIVHFPIALLMVVVVMALWARRRQQPLEFLRPLIVLGALSTVAAVASGLALAEEFEFFGFSARQLEYHRNLGIGGMVVAVLAAAVAMRKLGKAAVLTGMAAGLVGAGAHFGGVLVHGDDHFVLEPTAPKRAGAVTVSRSGGGSRAPVIVASIDDIPETVPYAMVDQVLQRSCTRCHDARKRKGELRLDREELALAGGAEGPGIVRGSRVDSLVFARISLPRDHDDFMPSKGQPLSEAEVELVGRWIDQGAAWN